MEEGTKVFLIIGLAVLIGIFGYAVKGTFGAVMGFVITLLIVGLFIIWKNYAGN